MLLNDVRTIINDNHISIYIDNTIFSTVVIGDNTFAQLCMLLDNEPDISIDLITDNGHLTISNTGSFVKMETVNSDDVALKRTILSRYEFTSMLESLVNESRRIGDFPYKYIFIVKVEAELEKYKKTAEFSEFEKYNFIKKTKK